RAEIEGLAALTGAPLHLLPIDVRAGTVFHERARDRGLLEGTFLYRRYRFEDRRTELFARAVLAFLGRLAERSVPIAFYDLGYNLGVVRRLVPRVAAAVDALGAEYAAIAAVWNADQLRLLRLFAEAAATVDAGAVDRLVAAESRWVRAHDDGLIERCDQALRALERAAGAALGAPVRAHPRGTLLSLALTVGLAACHHQALVGGQDAAAESDGTRGAPPDAPPDLGRFFLPDVPPSPDLGPPIDFAISTEAGCAALSKARLGPESKTPPGACTDGGEPVLTSELVSCATPCRQPAVLVFDGEGVLQGVESQQRDVVDCLKALLGKACYPSLACSR